jgi:Bifunctional DNA primase/polymerase, N-terminal
MLFSNNSIEVETPTAYNHRETAAEYAQRGWAPIPVKYKEKEPIPSGWQDLRITANEIEHWFSEDPTNIGILLGEPSGGLVDVDLDDGDAIRFAPAFLPATPAVFGRASRRSSHRLYRVGKIIYFYTYSPYNTSIDVKKLLLRHMKDTGALFDANRSATLKQYWRQKGWWCNSSEFENGYAFLSWAGDVLGERLANLRV